MRDGESIIVCATKLFSTSVSWKHPSLTQQCPARIWSESGRRSRHLTCFSPGESWSNLFRLAYESVRPSFPSSKTPHLIVNVSEIHSLLKKTKKKAPDLMELDLGLLSFSFYPCLCHTFRFPWEQTFWKNNDGKNCMSIVTYMHVSVFDLHRNAASH